MTTLSTPKKAGHVICMLVPAVQALNFFGLAREDEPGPPAGVIAFGVLVGVVSIALLVWSWRADNTLPRRIAAVLLVLAAISAVPAFLVDDVPAGLQAAAGLQILVTLVGVVLLFYPTRRPVITA